MDCEIGCYVDNYDTEISIYLCEEVQDVDIKLKRTQFKIDTWELTIINGKDCKNITEFGQIYEKDLIEIVMKHLEAIHFLNKEELSVMDVLM